LSLHKWWANEASIVETFPEQRQECQLPCTFEKHNRVKTLDLIWDPVQDVFQYSIKFKHFSGVIIKRTTLATISSIFDALGVLGVIISYKIFTQHLWSRKLNWDEQFPLDLKKMDKFISATPLPQFHLCSEASRGEEQDKHTRSWIF
jgi:hypothetical protein